MNSVLLRRSYREGAKVKHEILANLAALPEHTVESLRGSRAGKTLLYALAPQTVTDQPTHQ
ncbi:hypothetical protein [Arthrobacter sp. MA-N2]|uniref:hypothetical protein n=1 Tax=Arthrobacter sp. MA-N2 TaxID=1101188 RepID=UPI00054CE82C|nr:hypothetical protein [Arthrobacter sp. MA-N2]